MHGKHSGEDELMAEMNMIPLIDIALTLVIILMVTTVFIRQPGVSLRLPESVTREGAPETAKDLIVTVTKDGGVYLEGQRKTSTELSTRLRQVAQANRQTRVLVKGDRDVPYSRVIDVMDLGRQAGLTRMVLPTDPKATQAALPRW